MGLTINYTIIAKSAQHALVGLKEIQNKCLDLPYEEVGEVKHRILTQEIVDYFDQLQRDYFYPNNSFDNLKKRDKLIADRGFTTWELITSNGQIGDFISLDIWPGEGCESCNINFMQDKNGTYKAEGFCKTQYAVHFVRCHSSVCTIFDLAKSAGFVIDVKDDGEFFETRDLKMLAKNLDDYNTVVAFVGGTLKKIGWDEGQVVCELDKNKSIIKITD